MLLTDNSILLEDSFLVIFYELNSIQCSLFTPPENVRFSDVCRGYKQGTPGTDGLTSHFF